VKIGDHARRSMKRKGEPRNIPSTQAPALIDNLRISAAARRRALKAAAAIMDAPITAGYLVTTPRPRNNPARKKDLSFFFRRCPGSTKDHEEKKDHQDVGTDQF